MPIRCRRDVNGGLEGALKLPAIVITETLGNLRDGKRTLKEPDGSGDLEFQPHALEIEARYLFEKVPKAARAKSDQVSRFLLRQPAVTFTQGLIDRKHPWRNRASFSPPPRA